MSKPTFSFWENGDIIRSNKGELCYITWKEIPGTVYHCPRYHVTFDNGETGIIDEASYMFTKYIFVARRFHLEPFSKVMVWKAGRWFGDIVSAYDEKFVWTVGSGRFRYKDVVPYIKENRTIFNSTERNTEMKFHQYKDGDDFLANIDKIKKEYNNEESQSNSQSQSEPLRNGLSERCH